LQQIKSELQSAMVLTGTPSATRVSRQILRSMPA
jgi:isopentenyl diphosphate isomerase/L-lactate dehydrogenase-like FMN-dependent dehydrogenase